MGLMIELEDLPGVLAEIAEVIGVDGALRLAQVAGGTDMYIPAKIDDDHWLAKALGSDLARKLCEHYRVGGFVSGNSGGTERMSQQGIRLVMPMATSIIRTAAIQDGLQQNLSANEIARRVGCHIRTVRRHRNKLRRRASRL